MKYSRLILLILALVWLFIPLNSKGKIIFIGIITLYLAFHNYFSLQLSQKNKITVNKLKYFKEKFGAKWGTGLYLIIFVFLPLAIGLYILISGLML